MSAAIGNVALALASAKNENTIALANVNFDFAIIKVSPPAEFDGLGLSLSPRRRREAEDGHTHTVARKLAALLNDDLPPIPNLIKAYGTRASEIAENPVANPKGTPQDGAFGDLVGADGTTIWAAATSGQNAVAIHLLACMLARIWNGPKATAIWAELIATRKTLLDKRLEGTEFKMEEVTASKIQLSREQLAEWDASARSWLSSADLACQQKQSQLMLILRNLGLSVPSDTSVYRSVMSAWKASLSFMESLVTGMPQAVENPAVLLAVSAWHLYPDMAVLRGKTRDVKQHDHLIAPGGIITIGLQNPNLGTDDGISWSLPLSHLRYYGKPVNSTGSVGTRSSRISMEQLLLVSFGAATIGWVRRLEDNSLCAKFFIILRKTASKSRQVPEWLDLLANAASRYLSYTKEARSEADILIGFGRRRCQSFLSSRRPLPMAFDIGRPDVFVKLLPGNEEKIKWLRQRFGEERPCSEARNNKLSEAVIHYYGPAASGHQGHESQPVSPTQPQSNLLREEWASLYPKFPDESGTLSHRRWLPIQPLLQGCRTHGTRFDPDYDQVPKWAIERCSDIKRGTGDSCTIVAYQEALTAKGLLNHFDGLFTWPGPPHKELSAEVNRLVRGFSLEEGLPELPRPPTQAEEIPAPTLAVPLHVPASIPDPKAASHIPEFVTPRTQLYPSSSSQNGSANRRSVALHGISDPAPSLGRATATTQPGKSRQSTVVGSSLPQQFQLATPSSHRSGILAEEVRKMANIINLELQAIRYKEKLQAVRTPSPSESPSESTSGSPEESDDGLTAETSIGDDRKQGSNGVVDNPQHNCECLNGFYLKRVSRTNTNTVLQKIFGDASLVSVYIPKGDLTSEFGPPDTRHNEDRSQLLALAQEYSDILMGLSLEEVIDALDKDLLDASALGHYLFKRDATFWLAEYQTHLLSLNALYFADSVYLNLAGALVDLSISALPLYEFHWSHSVPTNLAHARSFSCIAALESGRLNIPPSNLADVMGMSTGNSLYVAQFLWSDPHAPPPPSIIRRSIGNVGRPGMAFLISPASPKMKDAEFESWSIVLHRDFDGRLEASFEDTSLHLSFTGYEQALDTGEHGLLDKEVYLLETVVQAYERGAWFCDMDILAALNGHVGSRLIRRLPAWRSSANDFSRLGQVTAIDNWTELLDQPNNACVVRTGGNWLARLTATVIAVQKAKPVIIAPERICWGCVRACNLNFSITIIVA